MHSKYYEFSTSIAVHPSWLFAEAELGWKIRNDCSFKISYHFLLILHTLQY